MYYICIFIKSFLLDGSVKYLGRQQLEKPIHYLKHVIHERKKHHFGLNFSFLLVCNFALKMEDMTEMKISEASILFSVSLSRKCSGHMPSLFITFRDLQLIF
ncbi:hypothetical protein ACJX0J_022469, partial [Zea mays]